MAASLAPAPSASIEAGKVFIQTEHLDCNPYHADDLELSTGLFTDPTITTLYEDGKPRSVEQVAEHVNKIGVEAFENNHCTGLFTVREREGGNFVGHMYYLPWKEEAGTAEMGCIFHKAFWRKGYASELGRAIVQDYAQQMHDQKVKVNGSRFRVLVGTCWPQNVPSQKIMERLGMEFQGRIERWGSDRLLYHKVYGSEK